MSGIEVEELVVRRRGFELGPVTLHVGAGEVAALVGPNGSGKSTLIGASLGLVPIRAGAVRINGSTVDRRHPPTRTGTFLSSPGLLGWCDGPTNLRLVFTPAEVSDASIDRALADVGLDGAGAKRVSQYSTGMTTRLCLARAMLADPQALLLDEPTGGLDATGVAWLAEWLRALAGRGVAVLVSSHDPDFVERCGARVVRIAAGRLVPGEVDPTPPDAAGVARG